MSDDRPIALRASAAPTRPRSSLPADILAKLAGRTKQPLGDLFGLTRFGVNLTRLAPGAASSLRHAHSEQDEFVYILEGRPTLITDEGETPLGPGSCAGFAHGTGNAHCLVNRTDREVVILEIGDRSGDDAVTYPDDDLAGHSADGRQYRYTRKNGTPL